MGRDGGRRSSARQGLCSCRDAPLASGGLAFWNIAGAAMAGARPTMGRTRTGVTPETYREDALAAALLSGADQIPEASCWLPC